MKPSYRLLLLPFVPLILLVAAIWCAGEYDPDDGRDIKEHV